MAQTTTVILILLAGDTGVTGLLDTVLVEFQQAIDDWTGSPLPHVFCLYHRWSNQLGFAQAHQFRIEKGTLRISVSRTLQDYPPAPDIAAPVSGDVHGQVKTYLHYVTSKLTSEGPIRLVIGAHGYPGVGVGPLLNILKQLWLLSRLLLSPFDRQLRRLSWSDRISILSHRVFDSRSSPGGITSRAARTSPDLKLDQLSEALAPLPQARMKTLVLHSCQLSSVEVICALRLFPQQIACESDLGSCMLFHEWFSTFGDPSATDDRITTKCFDSLKSTSNAKGLFSSHLTAGIDNLLYHLNALGKRLDELVTDDLCSRDKIGTVRSLSEVSADAVDLSCFCTHLKALGTVYQDLLDALIKAVDQLQLTKAIKVGGFYSPFQLKGISVFLPRANNGGYSTTNLPASFRSKVPNWISFLDSWIRLTSNSGA